MGQEYAVTAVSEDLRQRFESVIGAELGRLRRRAPLLTDTDLGQVEASLWRVVGALFLDPLPRVGTAQLPFVRRLLG